MTTWNSISTFWSGLPTEIQVAAVAALTTVGTATVGAYLVVWQIGKQARNAIQQNRHNEALKLKLEVYKNITEICRDASVAETRLSSYVRQFEIDVALFRQMHSDGLSWSIPKARASTFLEKKRNLDEKTIELISITEKWQIIDPRIAIFRTAVNVAVHDIQTAFNEYFQVAMRIMPAELTAQPQQGSLFPWHPPNDQSAERLKRLGENLQQALMDLSSYIYDIEVEMQNLLLGELFENKVPARKPIDATLTVLRIDKYEELTAYFENETAWGRNKARTESEVRASHSEASR